MIKHVTVAWQRKPRMWACFVFGLLRTEREGKRWNENGGEDVYERRW